MSPVTAGLSGETSSTSAEEALDTSPERPDRVENPPELSPFYHPPHERVGSSGHGGEVSVPGSPHPVLLSPRVLTKPSSTLQRRQRSAPVAARLSSSARQVPVAARPARSLEFSCSLAAQEAPAVPARTCCCWRAVPALPPPCFIVPP